MKIPAWFITFCMYLLVDLGALMVILLAPQTDYSVLGAWFGWNILTLGIATCFAIVTKMERDGQLW